MAFGGGGLNQGPYQLDHLALIEIKSHLPVFEGVYYEPFSHGFASITIKRRLSMQVSTRGSPTNEFELSVQDKKKRVITILVVDDDDIHWLMVAILSRVYKFKTFSIWSDVSAVDIARIEHALEALVEAATEYGLKDVRNVELLFASKLMDTVDDGPFTGFAWLFADWMDQISPSLRRLQVDNWLWHTPIQPMPIPQPPHRQALVAAFERCAQLRSVDWRGVDDDIHDEFNGRLGFHWMQVLGAFCAQPKLRSLRDHWDTVRAIPLATAPLPHSLTLDCALSVSVAGSDAWWSTLLTTLPSLKQFLGKIDQLILYHYGDGSNQLFPWTSDDRAVELLVASLGISSPSTASKQLTVRMQRPYGAYQLLWMDNTLNNWLLVAGRHRVAIEFCCPLEFALPTVEQFDAIKEAILGMNIQGLMPLPAHDPQRITFDFNSGSKIELVLEAADP